MLSLLAALLPSSSLEDRLEDTLKRFPPNSYTKAQVVVWEAYCKELDNKSPLAFYSPERHSSRERIKYCHRVLTCWNYLNEAQWCNSIDERKEALDSLRAVLGEEMFAAGQMPY